MLACCCGGLPDSYDVYVLDDTPPAWVNEAVAEWGEFAGVRLTVHYPPGDFECDSDCITVQLATSQQVKANCPPDAIACTRLNHRDNYARILLQNDRPASEMQVAIIHEFGHAFDLGHACKGGSYAGHTCPRVTDAPTIMNPIAGASSKHVTCDDVHQYDEVHGWPDSTCDDPRLAGTEPLHLADP